MDFAYFFSLFPQLFDGVKNTVSLFLITIVCAIPIGLLMAFARKNILLSFYVWVVRGTPLLLQLFFMYYGLAFLPVVGEYLKLGRFQAAAIAFVLNYSAYFCEIFRGGLLSVEKGQYEAAKVLGFTKRQTAIKIVIPQMLRVSLPPITNEAITLVKDTALVAAISVTEILYFAKAAVNRDSNTLAYVAAALFYLFATFLLTKLFKYFEKKTRY